MFELVDIQLSYYSSSCGWWLQKMPAWFEQFCACRPSLRNDEWVDPEMLNVSRDLRFLCPWNSGINWVWYGCVWKCCVPLNPMVLLIIIPMKNGYFIGNINPTFSDTPILNQRCSLLTHHKNSHVSFLAGVDVQKMEQAWNWVSLRSTCSRLLEMHGSARYILSSCEELLRSMLRLTTRNDWGGTDCGTMAKSVGRALWRNGPPPMFCTWFSPLAEDVWDFLVIRRMATFFM